MRSLFIPNSSINADKQCHGVLLQFHDFIISNLDLLSFESLLPSFEGIVKDYGIESSVAFYLWRPILAEKIKQYDVDLSIQLQKKRLLRGLAANEKSSEITENDPNSFSASDEGMQDVSQDAPLLAIDNAVDHIEQNGNSPVTEPEEYLPFSRFI